MQNSHSVSNYNTILVHNLANISRNFGDTKQTWQSGRSNSSSAWESKACIQNQYQIQEFNQKDENL